MMHPAVIANVASTLFMTGMIWTIQIVHYPLFEQVGTHSFAGYALAHQRRISWLIVLPWAVQVLSSLALAIAPPVGTPRWLPVAGVVLAGVTVVATVVLAVPAHTRLSAGLDLEALRRLVTTNWVRTAAWTGHAAVALAIAVRAR